MRAFYLKEKAMSKPPEISSIGLPPEQHADRVVSEMMRYIIKQHVDILDPISEVLVGGFRAGGPRAQTRLAERIRKAGAKNVTVKTGKKGQYSLYFSCLDGFDPARNALIEVGDPIPEKPWLVYSLGNLRNPGHNQVPKITYTAMIFITHHVLSRAAQRLGLRTVTEMEMTSVAFFGAGLGIIKELGFEGLDNLPNTGQRVEIPIDKNAEDPENAKVTMIYKKHPTRKALVMTTVF
jgi:hypothetical protein